MACQAVLLIKKVRQLPVNIGRIGMPGTIVDILVTVAARILPVDRDMKFAVINQPTRFRIWSQKNGCHKK
jgi:hypothetical protein